MRVQFTKRRNFAICGITICLVCSLGWSFFSSQLKLGESLHPSAESYYKAEGHLAKDMIISLKQEGELVLSLERKKEIKDQYLKHELAILNYAQFSNDSVQVLLEKSKQLKSEDEQENLTSLLTGGNTK